MSELKTNRKKRTSSQTAGEPHIDHRKRPRNRTTQSCLNCHTSKRMCDRKKPCGRCVQLGLTGLCVYEVDNPSHRSDTQDDGSRLRQRVAELEGVIRQMKNKPHPRWVRSGANPELEKWHSPSHSGTVDDNEISESCSSSGSSSTPAQSPSSESAGGTATTLLLPLPITPALPAIASDHKMPSPTSPSNYHNTPSPFEPLSPALATPPDEFSSSARIAGEHQPFSADFDFASMFMAYPDLIASHDEGVHRTSHHHVLHHTKPFSTEHHMAFPPGGEHCGCLNEASSYQAVLELSLRLRKAADILKCSAYHRMGTQCLISQQVFELDTFTTSALGNVPYPPETPPMASSPSDRPTSSYGAAAPAFISHSRSLFSAPSNPAQSHNELRSWHPTQEITVTSNNYDDNFMSWRGPNVNQ